MGTLKLVANPTFETSVDIPIHGGTDVKVKFVFKHRTKTEIKSWEKSIKGKTDAEVILEMVESWELDDELTIENAEKLTENYAGAALAIIKKYLEEIAQARTKN
jgi:hypothetical protein